MPPIKDRFPRTRRRPIRRLLLTTALPIALSLSLAACAGFGSAGVDPMPTGAIANPVTAADLDAAFAYWDARYAENPGDRNNAYYYAEMLVRLDRYGQAAAVLQRATVAFPDDREIMAAYGKVLAAVGSFDEALAVIRRAQRADQPDWRLLSVEAAILDQTGDFTMARIIYQQAVQLAPNEASLWSNYAMSFVLTGDLARAEELLRRAVTLPTADARVRQNLALVLGLQGRFDEAERIALQDLPADQVAANMAALRSMLTTPDAWTQLAAGAGAI